MKEYYYVEGSDKKGPLSLEQLKSANISPETLVWTTGMSEWQRADSIDDLYEILQKMPPKQIPSDNRLNDFQNKTATSSDSYSTYTEYIKTHIKPESYLVWGILTTLLCCLPFGIISIVYASKVEGAYLSQQYDESLKYSRLAKKWSIAAIIGGAFLIILYLILILATNFFYRDSFNSYFYNQSYL